MPEWTSPPLSASPSTPFQTREWLALVAILLGVVLSALDTAIANTALPAIAADLQAPPATSVWVINAYQLAVVASLLPFAALGDLWGPRRIFIGGLAFFTAASLLCAFATTLPLLAGARALQGIGAGAVMSVNIALIRQLYPPSRLGRGVGLNALVVGIGFTLGPAVASLVLSVASWPWLFAINVPLGLLAIAFAVPTLQRSPRRGHGFDPATALLTALTFAALILALGAAAQREAWALVLLPLGVALLAGGLLLRRQAGHPAPMLPVDLLRRPMFALSTITAMAAFAAQGLAFVSLPFYFEAVLHRNPVDTGFLMMSWPVIVALAAPFAGRLSDRHPPGLLGGVGLSLLTLGLASLALLPAEPQTWDIVLRMAVCGAGFGFFQSPNLKALMSSAPPERSGGASGVIGMARLLGQTTGAALVALCFGLAGVHGSTVALALGAGFAGLAAAASFARLWAAH
ncbi:DHA2 family multidrug resistance protein-like MFS transporter [Rhodoferax ferrireducens]|uniref:DHA2 family multidrug resistance protein-like MFS transporter n=1 Tax=Rhodoferax ferrireducens TaxID=192843 RepID=A0ABU2CEV0_9BURK|nr:MFS transporter [Rhodoferax ferrireducens]MDR7379843.1 DHA2 family multidrug resistance protein-like MFS transporter [Rhodoferax ferrireducens]